MRAVLATRPGDPTALSVRDVKDPTPGPGEIVLLVRSTTVNFADYKSLRDGTEKSGNAFVPGHEAVGIVVDVGAGVQEFKVGQRVGAITNGGSYCEYAVASAYLAVPIPDRLADERVVGLIALATAMNVLTYCGRLQRGETVLVHAAAGGVGSTAVQMAQALGARMVIGTVGSEAKTDLVHRLGGIPLVTDYGPGVVNAVREILGEGADVVIDSVGGPALAASCSCLAPFGRLVICGHTAGREGNVATFELQQRNQAVLGYRGRLLLKHRPTVLMSAIQNGLDLILSRQIEVVVGARMSLEDAGEALRRLGQRESVGKLVIQVT